MLWWICMDHLMLVENGLASLEMDVPNPHETQEMPVALQNEVLEE